MRRWIEKLILLWIGLIILAAVVVVTALVLGAIATICLTIFVSLSIVIYVYPWLHNSGQQVSSRLRDALDPLCAPVPLLGPLVAHYGLFTSAFWTLTCGAAFALPATFCTALGLHVLSVGAIAVASLVVAVGLGLPFGGALALWPSPLATPGGGPLALAIAYVRNRLGSLF